MARLNHAGQVSNNWQFVVERATRWNLQANERSIDVLLVVARRASYLTS